MPMMMMEQIEDEDDGALLSLSIMSEILLMKPRKWQQFHDHAYHII